MPPADDTRGARCADDAAEGGRIDERQSAAVARRMPPLIALSYFEAAARSGSFATAARLLHVSPAAVSHQVKALEEHLGVTLFVRHHRKVVLTRAAEAALPRLQEGFAALAEAVDQLRAQGEDQWVVTVCAEPLFATKWLVPRLHRFYARCPQAELRLQASLSSVDSAHGGPVSAASFRRAGIDLSVRLGYGNHADLHTITLFELALQPLCAPALAQALHAPRDILRLPLLSDATHQRTAERFGWMEWLRLAGVRTTSPPRELCFGNGLLALEAALAGQGVLLASPVLVRAELDAGKLIAVFDRMLRAPLAYHLACPPAALERPIVAAFCDWLQEEIGREQIAPAKAATADASTRPPAETAR